MIAVMSWATSMDGHVLLPGRCVHERGDGDLCREARLSADRRAAAVGTAASLRDQQSSLLADRRDRPIALRE